ncbi:MAG: Efflux ABC transporter, ATP-binding protein, partial [uncultured Phycisphaerae bacterium]
ARRAGHEPQPRVRGPARAGRAVAVRRGRRGLRAARAQRQRQDHAISDPLDAAPRGAGDGEHPRDGRRGRARRGPPADRGRVPVAEPRQAAHRRRKPDAPGPPLRPARAGTRAARVGGPGVGRAGRAVARARRHVQRRHAPARRAGQGAAAPPARAADGRAEHRPRPRRPHRPVAPAPRDQRRRRDGAADHAPDGRGRALHAPGRARPGQAARVRHARGPEVTRRRRRRYDRHPRPRRRPYRPARPPRRRRRPAGRRRDGEGGARARSRARAARRRSRPGPGGLDLGGQADVGGRVRPTHGPTVPNGERRGDGGTADDLASL